MKVWRNFVVISRSHTMRALNLGHEVLAIVQASKTLPSFKDFFAIYRLVVLSWDEELSASRVAPSCCAF